MDPIAEENDGTFVVNTAHTVPQLHVVEGGPLGQQHLPGDDDAASVATTVLASEIGSVVGNPKDAYQRSITFVSHHVDDENNNSNSVGDWTITFYDDDSSTSKRRFARLQRGTSRCSIRIGHMSGAIAQYSKLQPGDLLRSINGKRFGASYTAQQAEAFMVQQSEATTDNNIISISVGNDAGDDTLVQATVLKPNPTTSCADLGLVVWFWGGLCIKSISNGSLFGSSVLKSNDRIVSVNNILCDRVNPEQFERVVNELPLEITVVVKRGKQRWSGKFG